MKSSGIKRGLAVAAISALAITGVPGTASAGPLTDTGLPITIASQSLGEASVKNDGTDNTVRLSAFAPAGVNAVNFTYTQGGGGVQTIASNVSRNDDGLFSFEWDVPPSAVGATIQLTVTDAAVPATTATKPVTINAAGSGVESVNVTDGSAKGVFDQPYASPNDGQIIAVDGTVSDDVTADVGIQAVGPGDPANPLVASGVATTDTEADTFQGLLDITGYDFAGGPDQLAVGARLDTPDDTDDIEGYTLYNQVITTVTAEPDEDQVPAGDSTDVTVTVTDQNGEPVAGANVDTAGFAGVFITDGNGEVVIPQAGGVTRFYYADTTATAGFQSGVDVRSEDVTVGNFVPGAATLAAESADGDAFDFDENAVGDITVQVQNQNGGDFDVNDAQDLDYFFQVTPFDGTAPVRLPAAPAVDTSTTDTNGEFDITVPTGPEGTYELFAELQDNPGTPADDGIDSTSVLTFKAGQSEVVFDEDGPETAPAGGEEVVEGALQLDDGTGLPGRQANITYASGGDAALNPAVTNPVTLDADGAFSVTVDDPTADPQLAELGGVLSVDPIASTFGDTMAATATQTVNFTLAELPDDAVVDIDITDATGKPGVAEAGTVTTDDPDVAGDQSAPGTEVTLTIDEGFFTSGDPADPTPAAGDDAGVLENLGQEITVTTDGSGEADFQIAIERNEGFDDDGMVDATVSSAVGDDEDGVSSDSIEWDSSDPLNGGELSLEVSPEDEQDNMTDPAPVNGEIAVDVFTTDQFGNLVGGEDVVITDNGDGSDLDPANPIVSDFDDEGDFTVTSDEEDDFTVTGTWDAPFEEFTGAGTATTAGTRNITDTLEVSFADFNLDDADVTITGSPEDNAPVNTAVTETVTVIGENGNPVPGLRVDITRTGPGATVDTQTLTTNANGQANYVFVGTAAGTALISAEVSTQDNLQVRTVTDTVTFGAVLPVEVDPNATLKGNNNGAKRNDKLRLRAVRGAAGATARLIQVRPGKRNIVVQEKTLNQRGNANFKVRDRNGRRFTKYVSIVQRQPGVSQRDRSNSKRVR